jgi:hypothetical protein
MENKLAALKVDETTNEDSIQEYQKDIKAECVSPANAQWPLADEESSVFFRIFRKSIKQS